MKLPEIYMGKFNNTDYKGHLNSLNKLKLKIDQIYKNKFYLNG